MGGGPVRLPRGFLRHTIRVEPYVGDGGRGPRYGPARDVRCHLMPTRRTIRTPQGRTITDASSALCQLDDADVLTPEARVTVHGRVVEVEAVERNELPRGPTPNHLEVIFR